MSAISLRQFVLPATGIYLIRIDGLAYKLLRTR